LLEITIPSSMHFCERRRAIAVADLYGDDRSQTFINQSHALAPENSVVIQSEFREGAGRRPVRSATTLVPELTARW
jgi:hypothetical protein